jgi:predicted MFS family arabinose efflux permease
LQMLYISKIPTILQAGFLCAQVAASQLTNDGPERVKALGLLTTSYTIGSVIGPSVGGMLGASGDYYLGAKLAVAGSLLSMFLTYLMPSTEETAPKSSPKTSSSSTSSYWNMQSVWDVLSVVWLFLAAKVISSTANAMSFTAFPLILKNTFQVDEKGLGFAMSFLSACNAIVNGILLEPIVKGIGKGNLMVVISTCLIAMTILFAVQGSLALPYFLPFLSSYGLYTFLASSVLLSIFQYVLATTITSESTARVNADAKGTLLGLEHSLFSAARIVTPQIGISLLQQGGIAYVAYACAGVYAAVTGVWYIGKDKAATVKQPPAVGQEWKEK